MRPIHLAMAALLAPATPAVAQEICALSNAVVAAACMAQHDTSCQTSGQRLATGATIAGGRAFQVGCAPEAALASGSDDCEPGRDCACDGIADVARGVIPGGVYHCAALMLSDCFEGGGTIALMIRSSGGTGTAWGHCTAG
ncbi:MAG: hypothetical protein KDK12_08145 [Rhodobacteraceae bacterium]|nr:hypothetical protein [Paracoccaceae bacterium]